MFSAEDIQEIVQSFPPTAGHHGLPPSLVLASKGQGFITLEQLRTDYERRITTESNRIPVSQLAHDLDVTPDILLQLARNGRQLALLSKDESKVIPIQEVEAITEMLRESLRTGIVSRSEIEKEYEIDFLTSGRRIWDELDDSVMIDDYICTRAYNEALSKQALSFVKRAVDGSTNIDLSAKDLEEVPGSPPRWLLLRRLEELASSAEYTDEIFVRETRDGIRVQSRRMRRRVFEDWNAPLLSGEIAYADLQSLVTDHPVYDSISEAISDFKKLADIEVVDTFALSEPWFSNLANKNIQALDQGETGVIDVLHDLKSNFQSSKKGQRSFPESLYGHVERKAEQNLVATLAKKTNVDYHRFGPLVLTKEQYIIEQDKLLDLAAGNANAQWDQLKENAPHEIKFAMSNIADTNHPTQGSLAKDKKTQKACDERFWSTISSLEAENEFAFATYWTDRVTSRVHIYTEGLNSISDTKLQDQLSELLATYIQKDLIPDSIAKARTQNLVLSRKAAKNIGKLETTIAGANSEVGELSNVLDKFAKKQSLPSPSPDFKETMIQDMHRRMTKANDGPVLYLTLIVVLLARHSDGVVYATGKFAPKLMRQLKGKVSEEEYARLEGWKEEAKKGSLTGEDREGMRGVARGE